MPITFTALPNIPLVQPQDDLVDLLMRALTDFGINLIDDDILVIAQKIVSKSEGRARTLSTITPSAKAVTLAALTGEDARVAELILQESNEILHASSKTIICEHLLGFMCPYAGIDRANVDQENVNSDEIALLLPRDPDQSAKSIRERLTAVTGKKLGVLIIDSQGRPWRQGTVGTCIGLSGIPAIIDLRGQKDLFGRIRRGAKIAVADELAAGASLLMGQNDERCPVIHVRGFPYELCESSLKEILRPRDKEALS